MKISFITTVFNEEKTIDDLLNSLFSQTKLPDEIIIVDGGSTDNTLSVISNLKSQISNKKIKIIKKIGNRAIGRNEAIKIATGSIIVCSDAGCILDKNWLKNITASFKDSNVDVVAGYYKGVAKSLFQQCLVPYILVMPDKVDPNNFLPAARSIAFRKSVWKQIGGFDEKYSHNEDYVFANKLKQNGAKIVFEKKAIVYWIPRKNIREAFTMFYRFAYGDGESALFRPKVFMIFARYIFGFLLFIAGIFLRSTQMIFYACVLVLMYIAWTIEKNYHYVKHWKAFFILPVLQIVSDIAIIIGTSKGIQKKLWDTRNRQ